MSLSNQSQSSRNLSGKVIVGIDSPGPDEMTIQEIEGKRQLIWDESTDHEYLERVKAKAKAKAKEIMVMAELEAEAMRATAEHEGYQQGLAQAQSELDAHINNISTEMENLLSQIGAQGATIYEERRQDILSLIKLAVEKTLKVELDTNRQASLEALTSEALDRIESQRRIAIKCAAQDAADLEQFIGTIQERNQQLKYWTVKGDESIQPGGIILESADGKVDNTIASRWQGVEPILNQLAEQLTAQDHKE